MIDKMFDVLEDLSKKIEKGGEFEFGKNRYRITESGETEVFDKEDNEWLPVREAIFKQIDSFLRDRLDDDQEDDCEDEECTCDEDCENCESGFDHFMDNIEEMGKIVDVSIKGHDITCKFANGEEHTAHCHPADVKNWSLDTGIAVCIGKWFANGSNRFNRMVHQGEKVYRVKEKMKEAIIRDRLEEARIRENKKRKHEEYLKRRAERKRFEEKSRHAVLIDGKTVFVSPVTFSELLKVLCL